jgi:hypothetical protein
VDKSRNQRSKNQTSTFAEAMVDSPPSLKLRWTSQEIKDQKVKHPPSLKLWWISQKIKHLPPLLCRLTNNFLFNGKSTIHLRFSYGGQVKKSKIKKSNIHLCFSYGGQVKNSNFFLLRRVS